MWWVCRRWYRDQGFVIGLNECSRGEDESAVLFVNALPIKWGGIDPSTILLLNDTTLEQGRRISPEGFSMGHLSQATRDSCGDYECILELHTIEVDT